MLRRLVNAKMFATQKFLEEEHEHSQSLEDQQIGEIMFTAAPSAGVAVYKPQQDGIEL